MFPLTRPVRQSLATGALLLSTVLPTGLVAMYAWRINRPGHIRDVEIELGRQLGLQVSLEAVRYPKPGEVLYQGVVLRQEEPRGKGLTEIARADVVRVVRNDRELTLHAETLKLSGESPRQAMAQVMTLIQRSGALPFDAVHLAAPSCELELNRDALRYSLQDLAGEFLADRSNPTLRVAYRMAEQGAGTRCELTLNRDRSAEPARTTLALKTLEGPPLPARVLNVLIDSAGWLGPRAKVDGTLTLSQSGGADWEAEFQGNLIDVDLSTLIDGRFPRLHLSGSARVALQSARWGDRAGQGTGWREARGELIAGTGSIGVDFLGALAREMKFRLSPRATRRDPRTSEVEFRSLGVGFELRPSGEIHLTGALGNEFSPETVLVNATAPLALAPAGTASVHGLIKALVPVADASAGLMVPLTSESRVLLCLPIAPGIAAPPGRTLGGN